MKSLTTLITTLTLLPLFSADEVTAQIESVCTRYKKQAVEYENKVGTHIDLNVLSQAKEYPFKKVPYEKIRRRSIEQEKNPHNSSDIDKLTKWEKQELVQKVMHTWTHQDFRRKIPIYIPTTRKMKT